MRIIGYAQLHNEKEKGNLENWLRCMSLCDVIYIWDQASTDGSRELYEDITKDIPIHVVYSPKNLFTDEIICKSKLLEMVKTSEPDADWIWWMDGDTMMDGRLLEGTNLRDYLATCKGYDGVRLGHYNLWRSDTWYRVDNSFHGFHITGRVPFWKFKPIMHFNLTRGLHNSALELPLGLDPKKVIRHDEFNYSLVHRGFATDKQIIDKYELYKGYGQHGWPLERLVDEETLEVEEISREILPFWFKVTDHINPTIKPTLREIMKASCDQ